MGLLNALHVLVQDQASSQKLAEEACQIELDILKKPIGKQDQYMAAFGGLTILDIAQDGKVKVSRLKFERGSRRGPGTKHHSFLHTRHPRCDHLQKQDEATRRNDQTVVNGGATLDVCWQCLLRLEFTLSRQSEIRVMLAANLMERCK